ncbi:MAG: endonuclease/exonuclease/phosphatase family protein [Bacteroidales bacterium]|jgi:endonuclease/exonuclease/phosphatase family metal-dependent hydrolase
MKKLVFLLLLFLGLNTSGQDLKVMTYNIRNNNPGNNDGVNAWQFRKDNVCGLLRFYEADIIGLQEALNDQVEYISSALNDYQWIGVGRDDGKEAGEYAPIFFRSGSVSLFKKGWFWLSDTPDTPGKGWDAVCVRICTWALFEHTESRKKFLVFNTHFDHKGTKARSKSVRLVLEKIAEINSSDLPVIFMGDLNLTPETEPIDHLKKELNDSKDISMQPPYGPAGTSNGFDFNSMLDKRIDYIFVNDMIKVNSYAVLSDSKDRKYYSDHLPVFVSIRF